MWGDGVFNRGAKMNNGANKMKSCTGLFVEL